MARRREDEREALRIARFVFPAMQVRAALGLGGLLAQILFAHLCTLLLGDLCDGRRMLDLASADVASGAKAFAWSGAVDAAGGWTVAALPAIYKGAVPLTPEEEWVNTNALPLVSPIVGSWKRPLSTLCDGKLAPHACGILRQALKNDW